MILFILGLLILIAGPIAVLRTRFSTYDEVARQRVQHKLSPAFAAIPVVLGLVLMGLSCITTVGTKDIGVVTTFGKPTGRDLENGLHVKAPWQKVNELDGAINPDSWNGIDHCLDVRIGDSTTACVEATIRWRIVPQQASVLYQDYRSNDVNKTIRDSLVVTQFKAALNDVLGGFDPLQQIKDAAKANAEKDASGTTPAKPVSANANLDAFSSAVQESMDQHLVLAAQNSKSNGAEQVKIVSVTLSFIHLAKSTQDKINDLNKEVGQTRVAEQHELTAAAQASANRQLSQSVSKDPNVLVSKCFDAVEEAVKVKYSLPAGFSCWQGGGSAVVVPAK